MDLIWHTEPRTLSDMLLRLRHDEKAAVDEALASVRRVYLAAFERWLEETPEEDVQERVFLTGQIDTLRRQLGLRKEPDRERIREQTRERVRRFRERELMSRIDPNEGENG